MAERRKILILVSLGLLGVDARAQSHAARSAAVRNAQVRQVIEAQLDAFAADDGIAAFSFASPGIRRQFGSPDHFLAMVRQAYPVVYRPSSVSFLAPREAGGAVYQPVRLADGNSRLWVALYRMQRQADGTWRIDGCELIPQAGTST